MKDTVGIGELRQNLSKFLRRVERGERLVVTDRNRPVAELGPLTRAGSPVERLASQGRATRPGNVLDFTPVKLAGQYPASDALQEVRGD